MSTKTICKQCEEGLKKWEGVTYESIMNAHRKHEDNLNFPELFYTVIIPFVIFQEHRKYCEIGDQGEPLQ